MSSMVNELRRVFFDDRLLITLSELCEASEVSPSQIRYWEKKGYIHSRQNQKNQSHKYTLKTLATVAGLKFYLDQGFTLATAFQKQNQQRDLHQSVKTFMMKRIHDVQEKSKQVEIDLGVVANAPGKRVVAIVDQNGETQLVLREQQN